MYNLRKRKTAPEDTKKEEPEQKPKKKERTSTGKRPREEEFDEDHPALAEAEVAPSLPKLKKKPKSEYQLARIGRAKRQRMFLIDAVERSPQQWWFTVQGHSGSYYNVSISRTLGCTCPDFYRQRKPCKHLYFIVCQVAQFDQLLDRMSNTLNMTLTNLTLLSGMLRVRLGARLKPKDKGEQAKKDEADKPNEEIKLGDDKDCAICFEELEETEDLKQCKQCKKFFHDGCLKAWLLKNTTCPLCRYDLSADLQIKPPVPASRDDLNLEGLDPSHPLYHLSRVNLIVASSAP